MAAGGISALVHSLQEGSSRAKAAAVELLLGFAMDGVDNQEWIGAAPGAIPALVDMLRSAFLLWQLLHRCACFEHGSRPHAGRARCKPSQGLLETA